jgi:hypothetical protein
MSSLRLAATAALASPPAAAVLLVLSVSVEECLFRIAIIPFPAGRLGEARSEAKVTHATLRQNVNELAERKEFTGGKGLYINI